MRPSIQISLVIGLASFTLPAVASEGKRLFEYFKCAECHGADGKVSNNHLAQKPLAGMPSEHVAKVVRGFLQRGEHAHVGGANCAEPPSPVQLKQIAEYVSSLPR